MHVPVTIVELSDSQSKPLSVYGQINDANKPQSSGVFDTSPVGSSSAPTVGSPMPAFGTSSSPMVGASSSTNVGSMRKWNLPRVVVDFLGAAMLVTIILDLWRLFLGLIIHVPDSKTCAQPGFPWFPGHTNSKLMFVFYLDALLYHPDKI